MQQYPHDPSLPPQPPAPRKRRKGVIVLSSILGSLVLFGGCTAAIVASSGDGGGTAISSPTPSDTTQPADATTEPTTEETEPAAVPSPDGTFTGTCDYELFPNYFDAEVDVENTGNVGMVVKVTVTWPQYAAAAVKASKTVRVGYGKTKTVQFRRHATTSEIDRLQSWQERHDYEDGCKYHGSMVDTFGTVH